VHSPIRSYMSEVVVEEFGDRVREILKKLKLSRS
jgi:hypothetical protein